MPKPISFGTLSEDEWISFHDFLGLRLQLAFTAFARDQTGRLWKSRQMHFTQEFLQALHFVGLSRMFPTGDYLNDFTGKLIEDWDVIFDEVEKGCQPDYSGAEGWVMDLLPFHELMPMAWWKSDDDLPDSPPSKPLTGLQESLAVWRAYTTTLTSQGPGGNYSEDYSDALGDCLQGLASYRDGAADMLDSCSQTVIPGLQSAVNRISDVCLYPLYLGWYRIGSRETMLARRRDYYMRATPSAVGPDGSPANKRPPAVFHPATVGPDALPTHSQHIRRMDGYKKRSNPASFAPGSFPANAPPPAACNPAAVGPASPTNTRTPAPFLPASIRPHDSPAPQGN